MKKMEKPKLYYVEIVSNEGQVVHRLGPMPGYRADKIDTAQNINLDHERYRTRIVPE